MGNSPVKGGGRKRHSGGDAEEGDKIPGIRPRW